MLDRGARRDQQRLDRAPLLLAGDRVDRRVEGPRRREEGEQHEHRRRRAVGRSRCASPAGGGGTAAAESRPSAVRAACAAGPPVQRAAAGRRSATRREHGGARAPDVAVGGPHGRTAWLRADTVASASMRERPRAGRHVDPGVGSPRSSINCRPPSSARRSAATGPRASRPAASRSGPLSSATRTATGASAPERASPSRDGGCRRSISVQRGADARACSRGPASDTSPSASGG